MEEQNVIKTEEMEEKTGDQELSAGIPKQPGDDGQLLDSSGKAGDEGKPAGETPKPDNAKRVMSLIIAVLLIAIAVIIYLFLHKQPEVPEISDDSGSGIVITPDRYISDMEDKVSKGMIAVKMTGEWYFEDGNSAGNGYVANSQHNSAPLKITVTLNDTGEVVLETDPIPVGYSVENFTLGKHLSKGDYPATVTHSTVDENGEVTNSVRTEITIHVLN